MSTAYWFNDQRLGSGQCPVNRYNRHLRDPIAVGKAKPSSVVSYELPLDQATEGYRHFDARDDVAHSRLRFAEAGVWPS